jgi:hypothetical protein
MGETMTEFQIGDIVTYFPYEDQHKAKVVDISFHTVFGVKDGRVWYHLASVNGTEVNTITTGTSIKESKLFVDNSSN